jgi:Rrf2 family protein
MAHILNLSEAGSLALHGMIVIAQGEGSLMNVKQIADVLGASDNHLNKVLQRLVKSGFLSSVRGPKGGFRLSQKPQEIRLIDIYESVEGKVSSGCLLSRNQCVISKCVFGGWLHKINSEFVELLTQKSLQDFCEGMK